MNYKEIRNLLKINRNNIPKVKAFISEYNRMEKILQIEMNKKNKDERYISMLKNHLSTISSLDLSFLNNITKIIETSDRVNPIYYNIILMYFFERKSYTQIQIETQYTIPTIKKYIERGIKEIEVIINETK